jgi:hypothetical protein
MSICKFEHTEYQDYPCQLSHTHANVRPIDFSEIFNANIVYLINFSIEEDKPIQCE